ncbi:MAG: 23S rRNA (uracil(1939)-C(5))-methyltransferase RlmD, partial [Ruminococcaceae bacterium]|nr:23S rRNA (uracil(1939)-C(5))-methyltransferase RlmD [Oscillospiraceae bacterium]
MHVCINGGSHNLLRSFLSYVYFPCVTEYTVLMIWCVLPLYPHRRRLSSRLTALGENFCALIDIPPLICYTSCTSNIIRCPLWGSAMRFDTMKHEKAPLTKNQRLELDIVAAGSGGEGIGRHEGFAVFVPAAAVGDRIEAHIVKVQRSMAYARIARIIEPSADRIPADCEAFPRCGGCVYRHINYQAECALKRQRVTDALRRIGGLDLEAEEILPSPQSDHYRNKAQLPCQKTENGIGFGFYAQRSHRIVQCADCLLQPESFSAIAAATAQYMDRVGVEPYDEVNHSGLVRHLYIRASRHSGEIMVCLVINGNRLPEEELLADLICAAEPKVSGVLININKKRTNVILGERCRVIRGSEHITERLL